MFVDEGTNRDYLAIRHQVSLDPTRCTPKPTIIPCMR